MSSEKTQNVLLNLLSNALFKKPLAIPEDTDWNGVYHESIWQSVSSLAFSSVNSNDIPADIYQKWKRNIGVQLTLNSKNFYDHTTIDRMMSQAEIPYVILKGCVSASYYDDPYLRAMGDVDFLVEEKDVSKTCRLLELNGYVSEDVDHEYEKAYVKDGFVAEVHWNINGVPGGKAGEVVSAYFDDIFEKSSYVSLGGAQYVSPSAFHHGLIMLLHIARHMITGGIGLRHLCDWAVFVEKIGNDFPALFENKLKKAGLWRFAVLLTQFSVVYLGASEQKWMGKPERKLLENLKNDIFAGGNFGKKDKKRSDEAKFITSRNKGGVNDDSNLKQSVLSANEIVRKHWKSAAKFPLIYPIGWLYFGGRYLIRAILGKRKKINVNELIDGANARKEIYKKLRLFEKQ